MKWNWPPRAEGWKAVWERYKYVLLVILVGVGLLLLPEGEHTQPGEEGSTTPAISFDLEGMEEKLEKALGQIRGAGNVTVVLTLKGSSRQILAQDTTLDDNRQDISTVVLSKGSGTESPVVIQSVYPQYQGALIVCDGGEDPQVKLAILEAVRAVTGLNSDRISICKRQ